jgi:hypothetical protein
VLETLLIVGLAALLAFASWAPPTWLLASAVVLSAIGAGFGVPWGVIYHWRLHAVLAPRGQLGRGWWFHPTPYHRHLSDPTERGWVMDAFVLGAVGFVVACAGGVVFVAALLRMA